MENKDEIIKELRKRIATLEELPKVEDMKIVESGLKEEMAKLNLDKAAEDLRLATEKLTPLFSFLGTNEFKSCYETWLKSNK